MKKISLALLVLFLCVMVALLCYALSQTLPTATNGERANAFAALLGSLVGAMGAALAVYLTLTGQRHEDRVRIQNSIKREVIEFCRLINGHLETCENIRSGLISVPGELLVQLTALPEPIIYPAIADKVALLPSPQNVVAFYTRIHEINFLVVPAILSDPLIKKTILKEHNIRSLVDAFTNLLVFANGIIDNSRHNADFDEAVRKHILSENNNSVTTSREKFKLPAEKRQ